MSTELSAIKVGLAIVLLGLFFSVALGISFASPVASPPAWLVACVPVPWFRVPASEPCLLVAFGLSVVSGTGHHGAPSLLCRSLLWLGPSALVSLLRRGIVGVA